LAIVTIGLIIIAATMTWAFRPQIITASASYMGLARSMYPGISGSRIDSCALCHPSAAGGPIKNNYSWDWSDWGGGQDAMTAFASIASMDSDGDGFSNIAEINAHTFPGDLNDYPVATPTNTPAPSATRTQTLVLTSTPEATANPTHTSVAANTPTVNHTAEATNTPVQTATPSTPTATAQQPTPTQIPGVSPTPTATLSPYTGRARGTVHLEGRNDHSEAVISIAGLYAVTDAAGQYRIDNVPAGVWSAVTGHSAYLSSLRSAVVVLSGQDVVLPDVTLRGGDANGDCTTNLFDLVIIAVAYNPGGPLSDARADLNADGIVNIQDLVLAAKNYGLSCPQTW
jgi:hypothetical protein